MVVDHVGDLRRLESTLLGEEPPHAAGRIGARLGDAVDLDAIAGRHQQRLDHGLAGDQRAQRPHDLLLAKRQLLAHRDRSRPPADADDEQLAHSTILRIR